MRGNDEAVLTRPRAWIALAGALILGALAYGLLQSGANATAPASAGGYGPTGPGNGKPACHQLQGGYQVPCPSNVSSIKSTPSAPKVGKGFVVTFKSTSGGEYNVSVERKNKVTVLETGATGSGKTATKKVGKTLKAGKYTLIVKVQAAGKPDTAKHALVIKKK